MVPIECTRVALPWAPGHHMALVEFDAPKSGERASGGACARGREFVYYVKGKGSTLRVRVRMSPTRPLPPRPSPDGPWECCPRRALRNTVKMMEENFGLTMKVSGEGGSARGVRESGG